MSPDDIESVLVTLTAHDCGWRAEVPARYGTFLGRAVGLDLTTRQVPAVGPPPRIDPAEIELAKRLLAAFDQIIAEARRHFEQYTAQADDLDAALHVRDPHIWIDREELLEAGEGRWVFIVERDDAPDFGYHIEFEGERCVRIWAGD